MRQEVKILRSGADSKIVNAGSDHIGPLENRSGLGSEFILKRSLEEITQISNLVVIEKHTLRECRDKVYVQPSLPSTESLQCVESVGDAISRQRVGPEYPSSE